MLQQRLRSLEPALPWLAFLALGLWVFPLRGMDRGFASYGDPLEVFWSVERHCQALKGGEWFLQAPEVAYPFGLDLRLYPQWLSINLLMTPFCFLPGRILVMNLLTVAAVAGIFWGAISAARKLRLSQIPAILAALSIAFYSLQFFQTIEHFNQLLGLLALTWFWVGLLHAAGDSRPLRWKRGLICGLLWGASLLFSLYFFWLGLLLLSLLGKKLWQERVFILAVGGGMAIIGLPVALMFALAVGKTETVFYLHDLYIYAASPDLWPLPSVYHLWWGNAVWSYISHQPFEGNLAMLGPLPFVLGLVGFVLAIREKRASLSRFLWPTLSGLCLSLGIYLKWRTQLVHIPRIETLHGLLWRLGHALKPALFSTSEPFPWLRDAIPLPGFLWVLLPFAEGGRAMVRYLFIATPGLYLAAGYGLSRLSRRWLRVLLGAFWASELILTPIRWKLLDTVHPALEWLARQPGEGAVLSLSRDGVAWSGREMWGSLFHQHPLIHASGWWIPPRLGTIAATLVQGPQEFEQAIHQLRQLGLEYLLLHRDGPLAQTLEQWARESPQLTFIQCFAPPDRESPWPSEICVFRAQPLSMEPGELLLLSGWSDPEPWGIWAEGERSEVVFWATGDTAVLDINIFPLCVPGKRQSMEIWINGHLWQSLRFQTCDPIVFREPIPQDLLRPHNLLTFRYAYALSPAEIPNLESGDRRRLSVGFVRLRIEPASP
ncbi:MAG: hypothetical protein H5T61_13530 [Thermoflexales bacterium]|nr:hypothetical protein [Thermoflexales bacterium]